MLDLLSLRSLRALLFRGGRKLYQYARREAANHPRHNGEYRLLEAVIERCPDGPVTLIDVGAHRGEWTAAALAALSQHARRGTVHGFEPTPAAQRQLEQRFAGEPRVVLQQLALSRQAGTAKLFVVGELAGTNSLENQGSGAPLEVAVTTLDRYLTEQGIERVTLLKSDAEGHDLAILQGGVHALCEGRVDVWQFEYNSRWIHARAFLRDVFELTRSAPYVLGKLHRGGIELYESWHPELERYFETNFVLLRRGSAFEALGQPMRFDASNSPVPRA